MSTINSTFFLKKPKSDNETLILFSCYFKYEEKKFVYSTGEKIKPSAWDFKNRQPLAHGPKKDKDYNSIRKQLNRYSDKFAEIQSRSKMYGEEFTSQLLREEFDKEFKKAKSGKNIFFKAYEKFMQDNQKQQKWSPNTIKRYNNIKGILKDFEADTGFNLHFKAINKRFHIEFTDYCMNKKKHATNTYRRNLGLFKTFMFYALDNGYTYQDDFRKFKKMKEAFTEKIALKAEDLTKLMAHDFDLPRLERARDVFVFACTTGMRYGELKLIGKHNVIDGAILLKEEKGVNKKPREIPLNNLSEMILRKYDYQLPLIANQKQNEYIKDVFEDAGYDFESERVIVKGKTVLREKMPFYRRISTHTARRTFITMMKRQKVSDKLIASISGHSDIKTLNTYYQVDHEAKKEAVSEVFNNIVPPLRKVN
ncbi:tyrosine-type recombinase/integrase [Pareuzebyella sediminis]|uniref:tyrosine-type recombinase/integrase n=1 Tax=Pareuzebyella sediminis TaxID=2607998 RepID=UPI001E35A15D|nr:tyrosine-type recombinase/integrase [Pareuzebyella sediminis]